MLKWTNMLQKAKFINCVHHLPHLYTATRTATIIQASCTQITYCSNIMIITTTAEQQLFQRNIDLLV